MAAKKNTTKKTTKTTGRAAQRKPARRTRGQAPVEPMPVEAPAPAETPAAPTAHDDAPRSRQEPQAGPSPKGKKMSGLDAAVVVLAEVGKPLNTTEMVEAMLERGLWTTGGKTPAATMYSAIIREIKVRGDKARFHKTDRGHFELTPAGIASLSAAE